MAGFVGNANGPDYYKELCQHTLTSHKTKKLSSKRNDKVLLFQKLHGNLSSSHQEILMEISKPKPVIVYDQITFRTYTTQISWVFEWISVRERELTANSYCSSPPRTRDGRFEEGM